MALTKVSSSLVSDNAVTSGKIADGGIATADIADVAVTTAKIANNAILTQHIDDGQVTTAQLGADAVTADKIANDAISEEHLDITVITSLSAVTAATGDLLMVADVSDSNNLKKIPVSSILAGTHTGAVNTSGTISSGAITSSGIVTGTQLKSATTSTSAAVLKLEDTGVATYDFSFPDTSTILLGVNDQGGTTSNKVLKLLNAGSGTLGLNVEGAATFNSTISSGAITSTGNSVLTGSGSSGSAFLVKRGSDGANALAVQNTGDVLIQASYLYVVSTAGSYFQHVARFRGGIQNDVGGAPLLISDNLNVDGIVQISGTTVIDASRNLTNIGTISSGAITSTGTLTVNTGALRLASLDTSVNDTESIGDIEFYSSDSSTGGAGVQAKISALSDSAYGVSYALSFATGSGASPTEKMRIKSSGNVGIGTGANVDELLHLEKTSGTTIVKTEVAANSTTGFEIKKTGPTTQNWRIVDGQTVNGSLEIYDMTDSRQVMVFDGEGDIGMGVTPATHAKLTLGGTRTSYSSVLAFDNNTTGGATFFMLASDNTWSAGGNKFLMGHGSPSSSAVDVAIDADGKVGIGNSSPTAKLHIKAATNGYDGGILIEDTDSSTKSGITHVNGGLYLSSNATNDHLFINSAGDILIGNTTVQPSSNHNNQAGFGYDVSASQLQIAATTNNAPMELSRNSSNDGNWITFRKQSNILGNLGTYGGTLYIGSTNGGIMFNGADIEPTTGATARANNTVSLGSTNYRFKNLHLHNSLYAHGGAFVIDQDGGGTFLGKTDNSTLRLITNNTERMRITNDGKINIGTTSTAHDGKFNLAGTGDNGIQVYMQHNETYVVGQLIGGSGVSTKTATLVFESNHLRAQTIEMESSGHKFNNGADFWHTRHFYTCMSEGANTRLNSRISNHEFEEGGTNRMTTSLTKTSGSNVWTAVITFSGEYQGNFHFRMKGYGAAACPTSLTIA